MIGHFTAMNHEKNVAVGCALLKYRAPRSDGRIYFRVFLVCNYSYNNIVGEAVYTPVANGAKAGTGCLEGTDQLYRGLCNITENILSKPNEPDYSTYTKKVEQFVTYETKDGRVFDKESDVKDLKVSYTIWTRTRTTLIPPSN